MASSRNVRLLVAYDGTEYCGWQIQSNEKTVQGVLEEALARLHGRDVRVTAAGRTDAGVHAAGQVVNFVSDATVPTDRFPQALNSLLPRDVRVLQSDVVDDRFSSRFSARWRTYKYLLYPGRISDPILHRYSLTIKRHLDIVRLNRLASQLVGIHDFTTFSAAGDQSDSKTREVRAASFHHEWPCVVFQIEANAFLRKMVRSVVGTVLGLAADERSPADLREIIESRDRSLAGETAPAKGLTLFQVDYGKHGFRHGV